MIAGTQMVLCLNPRYQTVAVYTSPEDITILTREEIVDGGSVVPGWRVQVEELFR